MNPTPPPSAEDAGPTPKAGRRGWSWGGYLRRHPVLRFFVMVLISLGIGIGIEKTSEFLSTNTEATQARFARFEGDAASGIRSVKPSTAFTLFMDAMGPSPETQARAARKRWEGERRFAIWQRMPPPNGNPAYYRSDTERDTDVRLGYWGNGEGNRSVGPFVLPVALADVIFHLLVSGTIVARVLVLGQIALGASVMALVFRWLVRRKWLGYGYGSLFGFCIGTIAVASGSAYATGFIITTAQAGLSSLGHIAGLSVGIGAVGSCCAALLQKSIELGLDHQTETLLEKI